MSTTSRTIGSTNQTSNRSANWPSTNLPVAPELSENWQLRTILVGAALGAALGMTTAWLLARSSAETRGGPPRISTGDALKVGITTFGLVRAIVGLGDMD